MPFDTHTMIGFFLLCCLLDFAPAGFLLVVAYRLRKRRKARSS